MVYPLNLFPPDSTTFVTNGLGYLGDAISVTVTEEANGSFELEMEYPIDGVRFADITYRSIIYVKANPYGKPQAFRVYKISKPMNGIVTYYAAHISYDLAGYTLEPWEANSCKEVFEGIPSHAVGLENFTFWTDVEAEGYFWQLNPVTLRNALGGDEGCVLALYGGEYEWDNFEVKLYSRRGQNYGSKILYGKNLTDITQEENCSNVYSAVYPYWANSTDEALITLPEKLVPALGEHDFTNILTLDLTQEFDGEPSDEELREAAQKYIEDNQIGIPEISITVSFVQLEQTEEYKHLQAYEHISLFDTVEVEFPKLGVSSTARVTTTVYDAIANRYTSITLGDSRANASDTIADQGVSVSNSVKNVTVTVNKHVDEANKNLSDKLSGEIVDAVDWLTNGNGNIQIVKDATGQWTTLYILDNNGLAEAVNVLRFTKTGLEFSSTGIEGPFVPVISQSGMLQVGRMNVTDTRQLTGASTAGLQAFLDEIAKRVATELVTTTGLAESLKNYIPTSAMSGIDANSSTMVPTSAFVHTLVTDKVPYEGISKSQLIITPYIDAYNMATDKSINTQCTNYINYVWNRYGTNCVKKTIIGSASFGNYGTVIGSIMTGPDGGVLPAYSSFIYLTYASTVRYFGTDVSTLFVKNATLA